MLAGIGRAVSATRSARPRFQGPATQPPPRQPLFQLSIGFERTPAGTQVTWKQEFASAEVAAAVAQIVAPANEQNLNRWQAEVAAPSR